MKKTLIFLFVISVLAAAAYYYNNAQIPWVSVSEEISTELPVDETEVIKTIDSIDNTASLEKNESIMLEKIGISINKTSLSGDANKIKEDIVESGGFWPWCEEYNGNYYDASISNNSYKTYLRLQGTNAKTCTFDAMATSYENFTVEQLRNNESWIFKNTFESGWYLYGIRPLLNTYSNNGWRGVQWVIIGKFKNDITNLFIECPNDLDITREDENDPSRTELKRENHQIFYEKYKSYFDQCEDFLRNNIEFLN